MREEGEIGFSYGHEGRTAYDDQRIEYRATLSHVPDDMWAFFADSGEAAAIRLGERTIGSLSIDDERVHRFHLRSGYEHLVAPAFEALRSSRSVTSVALSTGDGLALSLVLPMAATATTVGLLYELGDSPIEPELAPLGVAIPHDVDRVVAFVADTMETSPESEIDYLTTRVARRELLFHEVDGRIWAIGERRFDAHRSDCAHLGVIVGRNHRGLGLGTAMMQSLVRLAVEEGLTPLCSTEPANVAARRMILGAGFRSRHSMVQIELEHTSQRGDSDVG